MKKLLLVLAAVVLLTGCAQKDLKLDERTLANNAVAAVGEQAAQTNDTYVRLCNAKVFTVADCGKWREFYLEFQRVYPAAARSYQKSVTAGNEASAAASVRQIKALSNELAIYYLTVKGK